MRGKGGCGACSRGCGACSRGCGARSRGCGVHLSARVAVADGSQTVEVIVKPSHPDASPLGPGAAVTIDSSAGTWQGSVVDAGDGSYHRTLVAPSSPALAAIRVAVNGVPLGVYPRVDFR